MIKIKLLDYHINRNETIFQTYWLNHTLFKDIGLENP